MDSFYPFVDEKMLSREKTRARKLRAGQWWKRKCSTGICHYCGAVFPPSELTMDHVIPLARGGRSEKFNLVPSCKACNSAKRQLLPAEWEFYMARLRS